MNINFLFDTYNNVIYNEVMTYKENEEWEGFN